MFDNQYNLIYEDGKIIVNLVLMDFPTAQNITFTIGVPNRRVREVYFNIKAYPRPKRNTQQIFINNVYFMSLPSRVFEAGYNKDTTNKLGQLFIELITELYKRGVNLNQIKELLNEGINDNCKRCFVNPHLKEEQQFNLLKARADKIRKRQNKGSGLHGVKF